ncbi:MAG: hypothetical protein H6835_19060 [Planctomycetes bacterium]|nr:hypothetical protein [Planctomycetota bacterium]
MSMFCASPARRRIAAFAFHEFPHAEHVRIYAQMDALAHALDAEWRMVHEVAADPGQLQPDLRARCGTGLLCPQDRLAHRNDVEHLRATLPARFDAVVDALRELPQCSRAAAIVRPELQAAASAARWTRGYAPALIVSFGLGEAAMQAMVAAMLLDVPRVHVLDTLQGDTAYALLLPLHVQQSALLVAAADGVADALQQRFGPAIAPRLGELDRDGAPSAAMARALVGLAGRARPATEAPLGPLAAFRTAPARRGDEPAAARPLLLLSGERTGSNMLLGALEGCPTIACAGELFNRRDLVERRLDWLRGAEVDPALLRLRAADPGALHARLLRDGAARGAATVGCKLLYGHGLTDDRVVDHFASLPGLAVVHLLRRDRLRRYLSLARALRSDHWHADSGSQPTMRDAGPVHLEARDLAADFALNEQLEARYRALFAEHDPLELEYEDLVRDPQRAADRLGERLGTTLPALLARSRKTGGGRLPAMIENFDALRSAFAGTRWSALFDDTGETAQVAHRP